MNLEVIVYKKKKQFTIVVRYLETFTECLLGLDSNLKQSIMSDKQKRSVWINIMLSYNTVGFELFETEPQSQVHNTQNKLTVYELQ